VKEFWKSV